MNFTRLMLHRLHDATCYWCGRKTVMNGRKRDGGLKPETSTVDHLINAIDRPDELEHVTVNACHECNARRGGDASRNGHTALHKRIVSAEKAGYLAWAKKHNVPVGEISVATVINKAKSDTSQ